MTTPHPCALLALVGLAAACGTPKAPGGSGGGEDTGCDPVTWYEDADGDGFAGTAQEGCAAPDGAALEADDCDDTDAVVSPAATEACDGKDNNCDGEVDEGNTDSDGDGVADCVESCPVYVEAGASGNGSEASPYGSIQRALDVRGRCTDVWISPGTYAEAVVITDDGLNVVLHTDYDPEDATVRIAPPSGTGLRVDGAADLGLLGITLDGGTGTAGLIDSDPSLTVGGGLLVTGAVDLDARFVTVEGNAVTGHGGGVAVFDSDGVSLYRFTVRDNTAGAMGGGVYVADSEVDVLEASARHNTAGEAGGGLALIGWDGALSDSLIDENEATGGAVLGGGGALVGLGSRGLLDGNTFSNNVAEGGSGDGGGLLLDHADSTLVTNNDFMANSAVGSGGGLRSHSTGGSLGGIIASNVFVFDSPDAIALTYDDNLRVVYNTILGPRDYGVRLGATDATSLRVSLSNNLIAEAGQAGVIVDPEGTPLGSGDSVSLTTNLVWSSAGGYEGDFVGLSGPVTLTGNLFDDPILGDWADGDSCPDAASPAVDAATADAAITLDHDGVARSSGAGPDIGAYECH